MKSIQFKSVLFCYLFFISGQLYSQDILYKKDTTIVKVNITDFNGKTVTYQTPGDSLRRTHYISKSVLDSLTYQNGKSLSFSFQNKDLVPHLIKRNFISVDIFNLAFKNPNIWYERISESGRRSFVAELLINFKPEESAGWNGNNPLHYFNFTSYYFFTRVGINFYPFNYSLAKTGDIRIFNGLSVLLGSYRKINWEASPYSYYPVFAASLMYNLSCRIYLDDHLQIKGGLETSLLPMFTYLCPEIGMSIGF
jgi:hypothetical protein